ncbi:hypothetical protein OEZ86_005229 [Tetradesmus obliquus]|nr:hypothetical protein OEZ86_005229 [Tetradesmus obliquus]
MEPDLVVVLQAGQPPLKFLANYGRHASPCWQYEVVPAGGQQCEVVPAGGQQCEVVPAGGQQCEVVPAGGQQYEVVPAGGQQYEVVPAGGQQYEVVPAGRPYRTPADDVADWYAAAVQFLRRKGYLSHDQPHDKAS